MFYYIINKVTTANTFLLIQISVGRMGLKLYTNNIRKDTINLIDTYIFDSNIVIFHIFTNSTPSTRGVLVIVPGLQGKCVQNMVDIYPHIFAKHIYTKTSDVIYLKSKLIKHAVEMLN